MKQCFLFIYTYTLSIKLFKFFKIILISRIKFLFNGYQKWTMKFQFNYSVPQKGLRNSPITKMFVFQRFSR